MLTRSFSLAIQSRVQLNNILNLDFTFFSNTEDGVQDYFTSNTEDGEPVIFEINMEDRI